MCFFDLAAKPNLPPKDSHLFNNCPISENISFILSFQILPALSEDVSLKVFVTKSWRIYEIVQKYNFHLRGLFATRDWGRQHVCMGVRHSSESRGQYLLRRAELGSLLKSGVLLDRPFPRVMNFTSALNLTLRYIFYPPFMF